MWRVAAADTLENMMERAWLRQVYMNGLMINVSLADQIAANISKNAPTGVDVAGVTESHCGTAWTAAWHWHVFLTWTMKV
jgi:hypothetical protein